VTAAIPRARKIPLTVSQLSHIKGATFCLACMLYLQHCPVCGAQSRLLFMQSSSRDFRTSRPVTMVEGHLYLFAPHVLSHFGSCLRAFEHQNDLCTGYKCACTQQQSSCSHLGTPVAIEHKRPQRRIAMAMSLDDVAATHSHCTEPELRKHHNISMQHFLLTTSSVRNRHTHANV
jgi:hypothetical protein